MFADAVGLPLNGEETTTMFRAIFDKIKKGLAKTRGLFGGVVTHQLLQHQFPP